MKNFNGIYLQSSKDNERPESQLETTTEDLVQPKKFDNFFQARDFLNKNQNNPKIQYQNPKFSQNILLKNMKDGSSSQRYIQNGKESVINLNLNTINTEDLADVSEYSKTNAHFSREEHNCNVPVDKTMQILNNNIVRKTHVKSKNSANFPYFCPNPQNIFLKPITELIDEDEDKLISVEVEKNKTFENNYKNGNSRKKCTAYDSTWSGKAKFQSDNRKNQNSISSFDPKADMELKDLDEENEIRVEKQEVSHYSYNSKTQKEIKNDINRMESAFDHSKFENILSKNNSKILIIDSPKNSENHSKKISKDEFLKNFNKNSLIFNIQKNDNLNHSTSFQDLRIDLKFNDFQKNNRYFVNQSSIVNDSLEEISRSNIKIFETNRAGITKTNNSKSSVRISNFTYEDSLNFNSKKIKRKHDKSDIFELSKNNDISNKLISRDTLNKVGFDEMSNLQSFNISKNDLTLTNQLLQSEIKIDSNLNTQQKNLLKNEITCEISESLNDIDYLSSERNIKKNLLTNFDECDENLVTEKYDLSPNGEKNQKQFFDNKSNLNYSETIININHEHYSTPKKNQKNEILFKTDIKSNLKICKPVETDLDLGPISIFDRDFILNMINKEKVYEVSPNYLIKHQNLKGEFRSMLLDWLMELCEELAFKRDTFYSTVNYIDRYLAKSESIDNEILQLIGVVCLSISAKIEEVQIPKLEEYVLSTDNSYTIDQFLKLEKEILKALDWKFIPTTINNWLNWYLSQWDVYVDSFPMISERIQSNSGNKQTPYFKKTDETSYFNYRKICQIIDLIILDSNYLLFSSRMIVASTMFLVFGMHFDIFMNSKITDISYLNMICFKKNNFLSDIFSEFLFQSFGFKYQELFFSIIYVSGFLNFTFNYDLPLVARNNEELINEVHYEDFLSFQTHNPNNSQFIMNILS